MARPSFSSPQVNLYVTDVETSVRFYRDLFGFVERFRFERDGATVHVELALDGFVLGLASVAAAHADHRLQAVTQPHNAEIVLKTDDVDAAYAWLVEHGATPVTPPHTFAGGIRGAWLAGPDGEPISIYRPRPA